MDHRTHAWKRHRLGERAAGWLAGARDPVACLDAAGRLVYANPAFERLTGVTLLAAAGRPLAALQPFGSASADIAALLARARASGALEDAECCWPLPDGTEGALYVGVRADVDAAGTVLGYLVGGRDVTSQRQVERSLREREAEFRTLADNSPDNIIRYGLDGRAVYCNREIEGRVNVAVSRVLGRTALEAAPPGMLGAEDYHRLVLRALRTGEDGQVELSVLDPGGERHTHSVLIRAERDDDGTICGALAIGRDVSDIARARQALADKEREFRTLADNAGDNIVRWSVEGRLLYVNPAMAAQLGLAPSEAIGLDADTVGGGRFTQVADALRRVVAQDRPLLEDLRFNDPRDERERVHQIRLVPEHDDSGAVVSVLGIGRDVTEVVRQREAFEHLARTDALTGAANRQQLYERAPGLLESARRSGRRLGVMLLDLDGFKTVNDSLGHRAGDELLRAVAVQLQTCIRASDLLVRLGGDEFVLVVADIDSPAAVGAVAQKVRHALQQVALAGGRRAGRVDASIGVVTFPDDGADMDSLLAHADLAMYQAKRNGRGRIEYFRAELSAAMHRRAALEQALNDADPAHGLALHMQPVFALGPEPRVVGAEALLRWTHPVLGPLTPDEFIPVAEECGQIVPLGRWVLRQAAEAAVRWNRGRRHKLRVAVNVSTRQFALDDVATAVRDTLAQTGCEARWLMVEITESLLLADCGEVQRTLEALRAIGVTVAIDDFGTGYSALHYLARFKVDCLKIDKGFVQGIGEADRRGELVKAFVAMARALELDVVAEGIETPAQLAFLNRLGCGFGQGYLLARPMPMAAFEASLAAQPVLTA